MAYVFILGPETNLENRFPSVLLSSPPNIIPRSLAQEEGQGREVGFGIPYSLLSPKSVNDFFKKAVNYLQTFKGLNELLFIISIKQR